MAGSAWSATGTTPGQDPNAVYALGSSPGESARLQRQADELAADSRDLLDRVGLRPGHTVIDLGCGPRGILDMLAGRVAPAGRVVGLDADPAHTAMAAEFAAGRGLSGVEIMTADARRTGLRPAPLTWCTPARCWSTSPTPRTWPPRWCGWPGPAAGSRPWNPTPSMAGATRRTRPSTGSATSSRWPSAATAPTHGSAGGYRSCSARRGWKMSRWRPGCRCTRRAVPGGPSALISFAHAATGARDGPGQRRGTRRAGHGRPGLISRTPIRS